MARQRRVRATAAAKAVTPERAARLYRLLRLLAAGPQTRPALTRRLRLDLRSFYRDLELLRAAGIELRLHNSHYRLHEPIAAALTQLPFPDPHLNLGEARLLAKGRTPAHRKLKEQLARIVKPVSGQARRK
ncbi:MAG TPA: hypothetical protein VKI65_15865 [Gemmataceae bacterium]|nr:hypothetical protein [Gemmataceae bacterium]